MSLLGRLWVSILPGLAPALTAALALVSILGALGCAGHQAGPPRYKSVDELRQCYPGECVEALLSFRHRPDASHFRGRMPYHCDPGSELDGPPDPGVTRMIFVVHGVVGPTPEKLEALRIAPGLFQLRNVIHALRRAQTLDHTIASETIAIIAPTFQRTGEWEPYTDENKRVWTWPRTSWNTGTLADARDGVVKTDAVSSFDVFDEFMRAAVVKFPNLERIVIVGHSGGGQAVHRYAMLGVGVHERLVGAGIAVRYMPANPGLYAFPVQVRKMPPGATEVPPGPGPGDTEAWRWSAPRGCKEYDDWGYGLSDLIGTSGDRSVRAADYAIDNYLAPVDAELARRARRAPGSATWAKAARAALRLQYTSREIWHIQAANDQEGTFGPNCKATLQGRSRFERFSNFQEAWRVLAGVDASNLHFVALEDASNPHSSRVVYATDEGIELLFH